VWRRKGLGVRDGLADGIRATEVPVGEDQVQHLEFTREAAGTFHSFYGQVFPLPKTILCKKPTRSSDGPLLTTSAQHRRAE